MKGGTRVAAGVAAGYFMGRTKKMRLALMVTAAGLTGGLAKSPGELARRAVGGLGASVPVENLVDSVRGELKSAATAAASRRIDALTERLSGSLSADKNGADQEQSEEPEEPEEPEHSAEQEDQEQDEEPDHGQEDDDEAEEYRPVTRRRRSEPAQRRTDTTERRRSEPAEPRRSEPAKRRTSTAESRSEKPRTASARRTSRAGTATSGTAERRTRR